MASIIPKLLFIGNTQAGDIYSAPSAIGSYSIVKSINVCNTGTATETFSLNLVGPGQSLSIANAILANISLTAQNVFSYETSVVMPSGYSLNISQGNTNLTFTISGVEYDVV